MDTPTATTMEPSALPAINTPRRPYVDLFLISFLILFFELACIRWFGSTVVFLTFFTNIVLLACFLGMSIGLMTASRRQNFIRMVIPLTFLSVALAMVTFNVYNKYANKITIGVGNQQTSPQLIFFGTEYRKDDISRFVIPLWVVAGVFFTLISTTFIGLGQTMGRAFDAIPNRVKAYTIDVLGSLTGITAFGLISYARVSPHFWFLLVMLLALYFVRKWSALQVLAAMGTMYLIALSAYGVGQRGQIFWSPYYKVSYTPQTGEIETNNIAHQQMTRVEDDGPAYLMPHLINRDAGNEPFRDVMVIGAGSGNDVAAALRMGATHIDAVEIDPMIQQIGIWDHPDRPYQDPRVTRRNRDGRDFVRQTTGTYDLISYALTDSLVLHSGYSSLRLENFLFTERAFADVKAKLKPDGVFAMYNYYRFGWVVARNVAMAKRVFGVDPVVISMPFQGKINLEQNQSNFITFVLVGSNSKRLENIRKSFAANTNFWLNWHPSENDHINGFSPAPPDNSDGWKKISTATVDTAGVDLLPSDNWPQLYLRKKEIPWAPTGQGMVTVGVISIILLLLFTGPVWFRRGADGMRVARPSGHMFFLGAGFMLLETKGVVHMALLFGATWIVNSVVFFAILVMILIANLFVLTVKPQRFWPYYLLLAGALIVNALVPMDWFLSLPGAWKAVASCAVVFVPVFFAGVIFATSFRDSRQPDVDFGSNVAGIILGGLSEQFSLMVGFNYLLLVAVGYYALSGLLIRRKKIGGIVATPPIDAPALLPA